MGGGKEGVERFCASCKKFMVGDKQNYHRIVTSTARHVFISLGGSCTTASVVCKAKGGVEKQGEGRNCAECYSVHMYVYIPSRVPRSMTMGFSNPPLD